MPCRAPALAQCVLVWMLAVAVAVAVPELDAQTLGGAPYRRPVDEKLEDMEYEPPELPPALELPEVPAPAPAAPLSEQLRVYVQAIRLEGNTVFSDAELAEVTSAYEQREITAGELEALRQALTLYYVERGYINSGAEIPDQRVVDGTITIRIVEGTLADIRMRGNERLRSGYLTDRIELGAGPPLNVDKLGGQLQLLQQNSRIDRVHAALVPGAVPGEAVLDVRVQEAQPYHLWVGADNARPPSVGSEQGYVRLLHQNLTGFGDTLRFEFDKAEGLKEYDISYGFPVTSRDTLLRPWYLRNDSKIVESPFDDLDIEANERSFGVNLTHPAYRTLNRTLLLGLSLERRKSETTLLGEPFSFSPAAENGETKLSIVRLSQEWLERRLRRVLAARSTFSLGVDAFDATVNREEGDGEFFSWLGQIQWAQRFGANNQFILRSDVQYAHDDLPSLEQFSVGGLYTVRGYRQNRQVTDQGFIASLELRFPVWRSKDGRASLQIAPFYDYAAVWNRSRETPGPQYFSSPGIGILGDFTRRVQAAVYLAHPLQDFDDPDEDMQDDGVHFTLTVELL